MRRDNSGISRIVEFVIMFTVFIVIVTAFYSLANIWLRPPIVDYAQEEAIRVSGVLINNPGNMADGRTNWEEHNATEINSNLKSLGFAVDNFAVDNKSYGVLSMKKIIAMRNLTYEKAKQAMALDYLNFNITFRYFNGSIMLSNETDNETTLTFGANFGNNATVSWKRIVNIIDLNGKYENATLTVYLSKKGRFEERVVINEIMYHPAGADNTDEWVELYNCANMAVNVSGWRLGNASDMDLLYSYDGNGTIISSCGYAVVTDTTTNVYVNFSKTLAVNESPSALKLRVEDEAIGLNHLNNNGDEIILRNRYWDVVDSIDYTTLISKGADGNNNTLEKINPFRGNAGLGWTDNWKESTNTIDGQPCGGTPGRKNSIP